jgi:hypothetical protein
LYPFENVLLIVPERFLEDLLYLFDAIIEYINIIISFL